MINLIHLGGILNIVNYYAYINNSDIMLYVNNVK